VVVVVLGVAVVVVVLVVQDVFEKGMPWVHFNQESPQLIRAILGCSMWHCSYSLPSVARS